MTYTDKYRVTHELILCSKCHGKYNQVRWDEVNMRVEVLGYHICVHVVVLPYTCADYIFFHKKRGKQHPNICPLAKHDGGRLMPFDGKEN